MNLGESMTAPGFQSEMRQRCNLETGLCVHSSRSWTLWWKREPCSCLRTREARDFGTFHKCDALRTLSRFVFADVCQFGTSWRNRTSFLCYNCSDELLASMESYKCTGSCGRCSRTGARHTLLTGSAPGGIPMRLLAQPYPPKLAKLLAQILTAAQIDNT